MNKHCTVRLASFTVLFLLTSIQLLGQRSFWQPTNGPLGGDIREVLYHPLRKNTIYAALGWSGAIVRSTDSGQNWQDIGIGLPVSPAGWSIAMSKDGATLFAGTNGGLYRSDNGGDSWREAGFSGDWVTAIAFSPLDSNTLYLATWHSSAKVFKSTDGGKTYAEKGDFDTGAQIFAIIVDPKFPSNVYIFSLVKSFRSSDGGHEWSLMLELPSMYIQDATIDPMNPNTIYVATYFGGIFKTSTSGSSWEILHQTQPLRTRCIAVDPKDPSNVYVGTFGGVYKTTDGGSSWGYLALYPLMIYSISIDPFQPGAIIAGTEGAGIFKSNDFGVTWDWSSRGIRKTTINNIILDPSNPHTLYAATHGGGIHKTIDAGDNWNRLRLAFTLPQARNVAHFRGLALSSTNPDVLYVASTFRPAAVFKSTNAGVTWKEIASVDGVVIRDLVLDQSSTHILYAATDNHGIIKSTDDGISWYPSGLNKTLINGAALDPFDSHTLYAYGDGGLWKSADSGTTWNLKLDWAHPPMGYAKGQVLTLVINPDDPTQLYAAGTRVGYDHVIAKSTDGGESWQAVTHPFFGSQNEVRSLVVDWSTPNRIYAGVIDLSNNLNGIYRSNDGGVSWEAFSSGMTNATVTSLKLRGNNILYAGTYGGGVFKLDVSRTTLAISNPFSIPTLTDASPIFKQSLSTPPLFRGNIGQLVYAATSSDTTVCLASISEPDTLLVTFTQPRTTRQASVTVTARDVDSSTISYSTPIFQLLTNVQTLGGIPTRFALYQNYPNPSNPVTTIAFSIPKQIQISLTLYNVLGEHIEALVNEELPAGNYQVKWAPRNLPSGLYFYRLKSNEFTTTKKLLLLR